MNYLTIGFVRRGFSRSGGAEAYLKRLARGVVEAGHAAQLITTDEWPAGEWPFGPVQRLNGRSPRVFADELMAGRTTGECDVVMSLERVWRCDVFRAGDGVHEAWLERRERFSGAIAKTIRRWTRKHRDLLELERSLLAQQHAGRVIANSQMVRDEMIRFYAFPPERIDLVYNGVPVSRFAEAKQHRDRTRAELQLASTDIAVLFVGSGWERKGLRFAIETIERTGGDFRLVVAGRGDQKRFRSSRVQFVGEIPDASALYGAADIFLLPTIYDPFSNASLEALAAGLPVITTRANGFAEVMEDRLHGTIVADPSDIDSLLAALNDWRDTDRRTATIARNTKLAVKFDIGTNVTRTLEILLNVAALRGTARV
jgi:UDP-glucose:(heptosyl)LPS alpha-1,3-glucosyltransferase